jgi:hypothetical protein
MTTRDYIAFVGLEQADVDFIADRIDAPFVHHDVIPGIMVKDGTLWIEKAGRPRYVPVSKMVFHGIYEDDLDFIAGLALWGGACLPNARAMMECRLKLPCLVRALEYTQFGAPLRGFASPGVYYSTETVRVAKWGDWHCGENKETFDSNWTGDEPAIIEHFLQGDSVRVVLIGEQAWQIKLEGDDWRKSIHHSTAELMEIDPLLLEDTRRIGASFGLEIVANDYIVTPDNTRHLLEVNHIPNVTRFPEIQSAYRDYVIQWLNQD